MLNFFTLIKDFILATASSLITFIGVAIIIIGSIIAVYEFLTIIIKKGWSGRVFNEVRLDYAHYLILGLDFFIAKDLIDIVINPAFEGLIKLFLVIVIRSFLSYFLHKDIINIQHTKDFHK